jgi:hypothetical protein
MNIEIGQEIVWMGNDCVVESIIEHPDGNREIGIALNGRIYYDWLSEVVVKSIEIAEEIASG